jgi:hypothetical protein
LKILRKKFNDIMQKPFKSFKLANNTLSANPVNSLLKQKKGV